jgi:PAS domain S-box-containing protein
MAESKRTWSMGIQNWLYLLLILILLPLLVLQGYRYYDQYRDKQEEALQANLEMARAVAKSFESFVRDVLRQELVIGLAITSSTKMTSGDIIRLLETSGNYPAVRDFTWVNPDGVAIYSNNPALVGTNFRDRSFVRDVVSGRDWAVGELVVGKIYGKPTFGISCGIRDAKGKLLGVVFAAILPDRLDQQLSIERSMGGAISIVDRQGMLVYRYPAIDTPWEERSWLRQYPEYEEVFKGKEIAKTFFATYEGKERLAGIVPISSIGWAAGAGIRKEDVTGPIVNSLVRDAALFVAVSLIAFLIAAALSRKITSPIGALRTYASSLGEGEVPKKVDVENMPELQDLAKSFNAMAVKVRLRETALQESEERYRGVVQNTTAIILRVDPQGIIRFANERALQFFGYSAEELIGKHAVGTIVPERESTGRDLAAMVDGIAEMPDRYHSNANENIRKNGERVWIEWTNSGIYDTDGELKEFLSVGIDATERKQAEEALRNAKDELEERVKERTYELYKESLYARSLIEASLDPLVTISIDGKITDVNHASEEITGVSRGQLVGSDFSDFFTEPEKARAGYEEVFRHGFVRGYPLELKRRDGHVTPVLYNASVYRDETGQNMGVFAAARDITELKQSEAALRRLASELAMAEERERKRIAGVLHDEIAQTLAAARIRLDLLRDAPADPKDKQILQEVKTYLQQSIRETRALMTDIGNPLLFDLGVKAACEALAKRLMETHPVQIICDIQDEYKYLDSDVKTILFQLIRELLANVMKHSHAQNARIMINTENEHIRVQVSDDGVGYDPQKLGEPTDEGGFGIFSIRERLTAVNGSLRIESTPGAGTIVTANLPAALV